MTPIDRIRTGERRFARGLVGSCLLACVLIAGNDRAAAQAFPARTVRMIVPFPAGGTADAIPRIVGDWLARKWGEAVVIDNLTGAGGNIGAAAAYKAEPNGYTLLASPPAPLAINRHLYTKLTFDPAGFEPVIVIAQVPNALLVNPRKISAATVPEFIAHMKANPGKLNAATQGIGTTSHLTSEMLQMTAEVEVRHAR
jgi:tripartite-type tricarboxylate transporter receptor subunit TctC